MIPMILYALLLLSIAPGVRAYVVQRLEHMGNVPLPFLVAYLLVVFVLAPVFCVAFVATWPAREDIMKRRQDVARKEKEEAERERSEQHISEEIG